ncbi:hypothetical protein [Tenacibaculum aiptasiae]|uniref:hypothetical protein n=1 Tax=Tenacibaculum aiptasiae TaxID=426481 RepID=UPI00232C8500|nr:hypothetical protein [Tenacibaculum aiptasiae]
MTQEQQVKIKSNFISSHIVNEIAFWLKENSFKEFLEITNYSKKDFDKMVNLEFEWSIKDVAIISALLKRKLIMFHSVE